MKISIPIGTRGTLQEFKNNYTSSFLRKNGLRNYTQRIPLSPPVALATTVMTKYGELVVHDKDMLTFVGHGKWAREGK